MTKKGRKEIQKTFGNLAGGDIFVLNKTVIAVKLKNSLRIVRDNGEILINAICLQDGLPILRLIDHRESVIHIEI